MEPPKEKPPFWEILKALPFGLRFIWRADPRDFTILCVAAAFISPLTAVSIWCFKQLTDAMIQQDWNHGFIQWGLVLIGTYVFSNVLIPSISDYAEDALRLTLERSSSLKLNEKSAHLPYETLEDEGYRILSDGVNRKRHVILNCGSWIMLGLRHAGRVIGILLPSAAIFPGWVTVILLGSCAVQVILDQFSAEWWWTAFNFETREGRKLHYYQNRLNNPQGVAGLRGLNLVPTFLTRWTRLADALLHLSLTNARKSAWIYVSFLAIRTLSFGIALAILHADAKHGRVPVSSVVVFLTSYWGLTSGLEEISFLLRQIQREGGFLCLLKQYLSLEEESDAGKMEIPKQPLVIELQNVEFQYPRRKDDESAEQKTMDDLMVLKGVNLVMREGELTALVGENGAGKSTIILLLLGIFKPTRGQILVNGIPLGRIKSCVWRSTVGCVHQNEYPYHGTIREQILDGRPDEPADEEALQQAIRDSCVDQMIRRYGRGIDTPVGKAFSMPEDKAIEPNGGLRQAIALARVFYRQPRVCLLDEPTSGFDGEKERWVFDRLQHVCERSLTVFVAHKLSMVRRATRIVVLKNGVVAETGTHDELMKNNGPYASAFKKQAIEYDNP